MDKKIYLVIILSLLVLGVVIFLIIHFNNKKSTSIEASGTQTLSVQSLCDSGGEKWNSIISECNMTESFVEPFTDNLDIESFEKLYDINKYYSPKEIFDSDFFDGKKINIYILPITHFLECINLRDLENFTPNMNKGFVDFIRKLNSVLTNLKISEIPELINIMMLVNAVLYYNNKEEDKYTKFWFLCGPYMLARQEQNNTIGSLSLTKCLPPNNLILYYYNIPPSDLEATDCDLIKNTTNISDIMEKPVVTKYKISIVDLSVAQLKDLPFPNITEYNKISDAYLNIIQFYINNSRKLDTFTKKIENGEDNELLKEILELVVKYIEAIQYVLPNLPAFYVYRSSNLDKIKALINLENNDILSEDKLSEDKLSEDKLSEDKLSEDELSEDILPPS